MQAKTRSDLTGLLDDLPSLGPPRPAAETAAAWLPSRPGRTACPRDAAASARWS
jgi:hypothetical protein